MCMEEEADTVETFLVLCGSAHEGGAAKSGGSIKCDKSGRDVFYLAPTASQVRKTVRTDGFFTMNETPKAYSKALQPKIQELFQDIHAPQDLTVVLFGDHGSAKGAFLYGNSVLVGSDSTAAAAEADGLFFRAMSDVLTIADKNHLRVSIRAVRVQIDSVVDAFVEQAPRLNTTHSPERRLQEYVRRLALSNGTALNFEEDEDGFIHLAEQVEVRVGSLHDLRHVRDCIAAGKKIEQNACGGGPSPFTFMFRVAVATTTGPQCEWHIQFCELADRDWTSSIPDDAVEHKNSVDGVLRALVHRDKPAAEKFPEGHTSSVLARMLLHLPQSPKRPHSIRVFAHTAFSSIEATMELVAQLGRTTLGIALQGPDGEGAEEVDPQLQRHVDDLLHQCTILQAEVDALEREKKELTSKMNPAVAEDAQVEHLLPSTRRMSALNSSRQFTASITPPDTEQRQAKLRLQMLEQELAELTKEEDEANNAAKRHIKHISDEKERCLAKVTLLQKEHSSLMDKVQQQRTEFARKSEEIHLNASKQIRAALEKNRVLAEAANSEVKKVKELRQKELQSQRERELLDETRREQESIAQAKRRESDNTAKNIVASHETQKVFERSLTELRFQKQTLERERIELHREHEQAMTSLQTQATVLAEFAYQVSTVLATVEKRLPRDIKPPHVAVFDPAKRHNTAWLESKCTEMRNWLAERSNSDNLSPVGSVSPKRIHGPLRNPHSNFNEPPSPIANVTGNSSRLSLDELRQSMTKARSQHNRNMEVVKRSQERTSQLKGSV